MKSLLILFLATLPLQANPDLFRERFADPATRPEAIAMLTPGTRDHLFHTALAHQLAGREKEYAATIKAWKAAADRKDPVSSDGLETLEARRVLTDYDRDPKAALAEMIREMDLEFDDTRPDSAAEEKALPNSLDPALITAEAFRREVERVVKDTPYLRHSQELLYAELDDLENFPDAKIRWFIGNFKLTQHPKYVTLLAKGMSLKQPFQIASNLDPLSLAQMDELRKAVPAVLSSADFTTAYLAKLKPSTPKNLERDPAAHAAFLAKCRDYIVTLPPANNDLKAHVLYHHLRLQQAQGNHPKPDFLAYLKLPRRNHSLIRPASDLEGFVRPSDELNSITQCPTVPDDAALIESYLSHFLALSDTPDKDLIPLIQEKRLANLHARARILAGADPELYAPRLGAEEFKTLREEVRIGFAPTVPQIFSAAENVSLPLDLKNTPTLLIRIYELHGKSGDSGATVDLDGLVPHHTRSIEFTQQPAVLHRDNIALPELAGAGSWIVEFVAGRISARALVRKGNITPHITRTATGQEIRLFDERAQAVADFSVELGSENFAAKDGIATVPNSPNQPRTTGTVTAGKLSGEIKLGSRTDSLALKTAFLLDREQLLANQETTLHLRNQLTNHGQPLPLEKVKNATLTLKAKLLGGVTTERVIADPLALAETNSIPFLVPADLLSLTITLSGTVTPETSAEPLSLTQSETYDLNHALLTSRIGTMFFSPTEAGHRLELRGRNGEPLPNRPVTLSLDHRQYKAPVTVRLRTDDTGRIALGKLEDIATFTASSSSITDTTFTPPTRKVEIPETYIISTNQALRIPLTPDKIRTLVRLPSMMPRPFEISPDERLFVNFEPGSYRLTQGEHTTDITIFPADSVRGKWLVTSDEIVPITAPATPTVASAKVEGETLTILLAGASPETRVTVIAKRYAVPGWIPGLAAYPFEPASESHITREIRPSSFLTDRRLSDEMRYIIDRRAAKVFPGSMLPRPGQLLHRWTPEDIDQEEQDASDALSGDELPSLDGRGSSIPQAMKRRGGGNTASSHPTTLDFLAFPAALEFSLKPDAEGKIAIPLAKMEGAQFVEIIAADTVASDTVFLPLPASDTSLRDRRLARPLPAESHHIATRSAAALAPGAEVEIRNLLDADWRAFTTLEEAYQFLLGSTSSDDLRRFSFLPKWPTLDEKEKLALLAEHHCHELHLFLARKDTAFFDKHVKPFLAAKPEPKFIDDYLLARDLTGYLRPIAFSRLNAAEKALLAQALPAARKAIVSELDLRWQLEAPSPDAETVLFSQTLKGSDLTDTDSLGLARNGADYRGIPGVESLTGLISGGLRSGDAAVNRNSIDSILNNPSPANGVAYISEKMRHIIIPSINFEEGTSLEEAIDFLRLRTAELDTLELDPNKKGLNFVIQNPRSNTLDGGELDGAAAGTQFKGVDIDGPALNNTLRVRNIPLATALEYICDMATPKLRIKVDDFGVRLVPQTDTGEEFFTRTFRVPPDFMANLNNYGTGEEADADPFAPESGKSTGLLKPRAPIMELLKQQGIVFPEGSSVTMGANGQLLVTNTPSEIDKIEQLTAVVSSGEADHFSDSGELDVAPPELSSRPRLFPDRTRLWLESNYFRNTDSTDEDLIPLNRFWLELASWDGKGLFTSPHFNACTENANEALMCLAMLDLPFTAQKPEVAVDGSTLKVMAVAPMLLFYKDTRETQDIAPESPLLVRQSYHPLDEPFRTMNGKEIENTHTGDFRTGTAYGVSLVITNPTGIERRIETLAQIPAGSIPLASSVSIPEENVLPPIDDSDPTGDDAPATLSTAHDLEPYGVIRLQLAFYFPAAGDYTAYPLHVSENGTVLAHAQPRTLRVSAEPAPEDSASWEVLARDGTPEAVLNRLSTENLATIELDHILWRLRDKDFFLKATAILRQRLHMDEDVFLYAILHNDPASLSDLLESEESSQSLGSWFSSKLITITPAIHQGWETREFDPLVNARAHPFGENPFLMHGEAREHYQAFLDTLAWKPALSAADELTFTLFLFLQDRTGEALDRFAKIDPAALPDRLQYDYLHAVALFHQENPAEAKAIALPYAAKLPPGIWKDRYETVIAQADELSRPVAAVPAEEKDTAPTLEITHKSDDWGMILLKHTNLKKAEIRLYHIDLEILFSKDPFLKDGIESTLPPIAPNLTTEIPLNGNGTTVHALPAEFAKGNVLVAAESGNVKKLAIMDSRAIEIRTNPADRTVQIIDPATGKPLPKTYVKVYAESTNGSTAFHKDGYTDLRGKFDYLSHTATDPSTIRRLAILVSHPEKGTRTTVIDR